MNDSFDRAAALVAVDRDAAPARPEFERELWDVVESAARDQDDALVETRPATRRRDGAPWLAAAAIVGIVAVAATVVWLVDPSDSVVQTDVTTVPTTPVTAPATTTPATAPQPTATSAPPISTTAAPPTTTPLPTVEMITVSYLDPPPIYEPEVFAELDTEARSIALGDGFLVGGFMGDVYTPDDDQLVVLDLTDGTTARLDVDELPRGLTVGPGRVAYGEVLRTVPDDPAPEQRFVAISLAGDRAGQTILDVPSPGHPMDPLHDDFYEHSADGVIDVWNGDALLTPFLDPSGQTLPTPNVAWPHVRYDVDDDAVVAGDGPTWTLAVERDPTAPGSVTEHTLAGAAGSAVHTTWIGPNVGDDLDYGPPSVPVIAALLPDGTGTWYRLPDGWGLADSNVWGTLLARDADGRTQLAWFDLTTTVAPDPVLAAVPPVDPASLIGRSFTLQNPNIGAAPGTLPIDAFQWPVVIDGVTTDLRQYGGSCVLLSCDRAVALFAASGDLTNGNWPTDSYLVLLHTVATSDVMPAWTVTDAVTISDLPRSQAVQLGVEGCTFTGLDADMVPVAVSYEPDGPVTPNRVWAIDESTGLLTEPAIDLAWTCQANY
jgi:hypothetical protein